LRIAGFLQAAAEMLAAQPGGHRIPGPRPDRSHTSQPQAKGDHTEGRHDGDYKAATIDLLSLLERLSTGREILNLVTDMTNEQLDAVPPAGSFRFCDGQRTLEQVVCSLLKHQRHQIDAMEAAVT
jgi:hypothetical protein